MGFGDTFCSRNQYLLKGFVLRQFFNFRFLSALFFSLALLTPNSSIAQKVTEVAGTKLSPQGQFIAAEIERTFPDAPYMVYVANCESRGLIHFDHTGRPRPNSEGKSSAGGVFQVLLKLHAEEMDKYKLNPQQLADYLTFVRILYDRYGLNPWKSSQACWDKHYRRLATHRQPRG
jgi:hypothetical protein